jgi:signal transduction histidine kinase
VTRRLLVSYIGMAVLLLLVLEVPLAVLAASHERGLAVQSAERLAVGLAVSASEDMERHRISELGPLLQRYRAETGGEVVVVDSADHVLARSDSDADNEVATRQAMLTSALAGRTVGFFGRDEGRPWSMAAVPVSEDGREGGAVLLGFPASATEDRVHALWLGLGAFGLALLALTAAAGVVLARSLARPLATLEATVAQLAGGNLVARAPVEGPAEVRAVAVELNTMAQRLSDLLSAQGRFVADASHQLRSPLTALRLRLENLEMATPGDAEAIGAAEREVQRLTRIVDGLLALGRAEGSAPERVPVEVDRVIAERCDAWSALADERGVRIEQRARPCRVRLVPGDLDQILDNLLANAVDAVPDGGRVTVTLDRGEVHVTDDGPGMDLRERERAFDRFWQGRGRTGGSSGLGLAIVAQLSARNGARVELRDADPHGLDAVVVLPEG